MALDNTSSLLYLLVPNTVQYRILYGRIPGYPSVDGYHHVCRTQIILLMTWGLVSRVAVPRGDL